MKKVLALVAALSLLTAVLVSCNQAAAPAGPKVIGISKIVQHPALDAVETGIQDELKALGVEAKYDLQNANGDPNNAAQIAAKFLADKVDIAVGIATPTAQALVNTLTDIPVIYTAVTDPVSAGLVESASQGGKNVTGYSDASLVKAHLELLLRIKPEIKRIGFVYTTGEANAVVLKDQTEAAAKELGLEFVAGTIVNSAELKQAVLAIADRVDAYYVSTDNTVVSALPSLTEVALERKQPVMSADPASAQGGDIIAAYGFNYYKMGRATGKMIASILKGEKKTSDYPTQYLTDIKDVDVLVNLDVAAKLGLTIPQDIVDAASIIVKDGKVETRQ